MINEEYMRLIFQALPNAVDAGAHGLLKLLIAAVIAFPTAMRPEPLLHVRAYVFFQQIV